MEERYERHPVAFQALDDPQLPQRPTAVQWVGVYLLYERAELLHPARRWAGHVADMRVEIELGVIHPDRLVDPKRCGQVPLAKHGQQVDSLTHYLLHPRSRPPLRVC